MLVYSKYGTAIRKKQINTSALSARHLGVVLLTITTSLLIILKLSIWMFSNEVLLLKELKIEGNRFISVKEIHELIQVDYSKNIFNIDLDAIATQIKQHPLVKDLKVSRRLPSSIVVYIIEREPLALIYNSKLIAVDETGNSLPNLKLEMLHDYPIISNLAFANEQSTQSTELTAVLNFLEEIKKHHFTLYSEISEISYSKKMGIYFYLNEGSIPAFMGIHDFTQRSANLLEVLNLLNNKNSLSHIEYFDLRFKGQVVVKETVRS